MPRGGCRIAFAEECSESFYDADEDQDRYVPRPRVAAMKHRAMRLSTDFPEHEPSEAVGPWRTTEVERQAASRSSSLQSGEDDEVWLLIGRRHSVDERRESLEQGKSLFLRSLAEKADGLWRRRIAARAALLQQVEERVEGELTAQAQALDAAKRFWTERHIADKAYLERLEASSLTSLSSIALPPQQARAEAEWRLGMQEAAERSAHWAAQLPELVASHEQSAGELRRAYRRALSEAEAASRSVRDARSAVWPAGVARAPKKIFGSQGADEGPGPCLWLAVRNYLTACGGLNSAQSLALARVQREDARLAQLGAWVDEAMGRARSTEQGVHSGILSSSAKAAAGGGRAGDHSPKIRGDSDTSCGSAFSTPTSLPASSFDGRGGDSDDGTCSDEEGSSSSSESEEMLDTSMDVSVLVVHTQEVEFRTGADSAWAQAHLLFSVDLWLHLWPREEPEASAGSGQALPQESLSLAAACLRPVVDHCEDDPRVLQLRLRPPEPPSVLLTLGRKLKHRAWGGQEKERPRELWIRCADRAAAAELNASLELVEKLYPIVA